MGVMVSLAIVQTGFFAALAILCAALLLAIPRQAALGWLLVACLLITLEVAILRAVHGDHVGLVLCGALVPPLCLAVGRAVRVLLGIPPQSIRLIGAVAALTTLSLILLAVDVPYVVQTLPFQVACAIAIIDSVVCLHRARRRRWLDRAAMTTMSLSATIFLSRLIVFPAVFGWGAPYAAIARSPIEIALMTTSGLLATVNILLLLAMIVGQVVTDYRDRADRDSLTGLLNRAAFDRAAAGCGARGGAVVFCDIDHFKRVNDRYGHPVGDRVIRAFADLLDDTGLRAGRLGGEEFGLLLPGRSLADAERIADAVRRSFHDARLPVVAEDHRLSASFGVASYGPHRAPRDVFVEADAALYAAKEHGRNRVASFGKAVTTEPSRKAA